MVESLMAIEPERAGPDPSGSSLAATSGSTPIPKLQALSFHGSGAHRVYPVHVWTVQLDPESGAQPDLQSLPADERERAARFHFDIHRRRFVAGRNGLRAILSSYTGLHPSAVRFDYGPFGKPSLSAIHHSVHLQFNLSHCEDLALISLTLAGAVGIDLERVRHLEDATELVERFFSARESRLFQDLPATQRSEAFFNLWTRKEALLKATGEGIGHHLNQVEVTFLPGEPARILALPTFLGSPSDWSLTSFTPAPGYAAALAVPAQNAETKIGLWPGGTANPGAPNQML
jgi:4'-phosphopantetheinyl transferase